MLEGCPETSTGEVAYPIEVDYDYDRLEPGFLDGRGDGGLDRWASLLPPLHAPGLGEGRTPLVPIGRDVYIKDESQNPTWSHKDRLNRCAASAAVGAGARGIAVSSSGNHGASAAAYAARAGLDCIVLTATDTPPAVLEFMGAYGAHVFAAPDHARRPLLRAIVEHTGFHPVSSTTVTHTGHPFGVEGYKTIAYEIAADIGAPAAVYMPTGYGELLFGVWKGFTELHRLGLTDRVPELVACEPAAAGPLTAAIEQGLPAARVQPGPSDAYAITCAVGGYRATLAATSAGRSMRVSDKQMRAAQDQLRRQGLWVELSAAAGLAGLNAGAAPGGPVVCISTSSGFKDRPAGPRPGGATEDTWEGLQQRLVQAGVI
ncbi:pyridoxal-phosphate dependent enzyme [Glycomyces buryatensis]|uniref:Pyridoxal-phosphate dependent enzyme n=2 Tax=Glycomyces buryatensis TaxID=2570927 RepID=A0A4S8PTM8_9ACTN|nr:pyridoxal-phosphate dependent enzyme [Glycomyces buryatensis]